jgi:hypothetical protein
MLFYLVLTYRIHGYVVPPSVVVLHGYVVLPGVVVLVEDR